MDLVLDAYAGAGTDHNSRRRDDDSAFAALVPKPAYSWGYLTLEFVGEPEQWRDLVAWSQQVDRWLNVAVGSRESIDALVSAVRELEIKDQIETGLIWIERLVQRSRENSAYTFTLPEWLRELRAKLTTSEQETRWQRIVDALVVSGDMRVADLTD
jgi:hypothetical protein